MLKKIINLCPHTVTLLDEEDQPIMRFAKEDIPARCSYDYAEAEDINGIPIVRKEYRTTTGLWPERPNTYYIVSTYVFDANPNRTDLLVPNEVVKDWDGNNMGCRSLRRR